MWGPVVVTAEPTAEPVSTAELVAHVRGPEDGTDDDLLSGYALAARTHVEQMTGCRLIEQTVRFKTGEWPDLAALPVAPISAITGITYTDAQGSSQTLSTDVYETRLDGLEPSIVLKHAQSWPAVRPGSLIVVTATAGYGASGEDVPAPFRQAIRLLVGDMYLCRETADEGSMVTAPVAATVDALLCNYRRHLI